ncbi:class I SAM-dependent methyltransferase [Candidatus Nomurabacteria bacterium]|nr:class I SAM-dependent methyltransferase [Candidatus Nomurabacteria bacterium]
MSNEEHSSKWDKEYSKQGIPSSIKEEPSGALIWAMSNWKFISKNEYPKNSLDVGCGTGRNSIFINSLGSRVIGFDISKSAIQKANSRLNTESNNITFEVRDLSSGLPVDDSTIDFISDTFVYKHQVDDEVRKFYRSEANRVLKEDGKFLVSLAYKDDGYYGQCPIIENGGKLKKIIDPEIDVGSVLFDLKELVEEMSNFFSLEMLLDKEKEGIMHGKSYVRHTLATIWRKHVKR